ncbi:hypothetical protein C8J57DRAFT_1507789 [Mycena rebaudengoi]|nr:hypothetical protein C8J57DRAFT_1507789 [Mycena rebaudengoi]
MDAALEPLSPRFATRSGGTSIRSSGDSSISGGSMWRRRGFGLHSFLGHRTKDESELPLLGRRPDAQILTITTENVAPGRKPTTEPVPASEQQPPAKLARTLFRRLTTKLTRTQPTSPPPDGQHRRRRRRLAAAAAPPSVDTTWDARNAALLFFYVSSLH